MTQPAPLLRSFFDLTGTASRKRGWLVFGLLVLALVSAQLATIHAPDLSGPMTLAVGLVLILWLITLVQRLHDTGRSGAWGLFTLIPGVGILATLIILLLPRRAVVRQGHPIARRIGAAGLVLLAMLFVSRAFYWQPYWIPAESMKPTLLVGDYIIVTRIAAAALQRGDVVVFRHPVNGQDFVKRVMALPGDTLQMEDGMVVLNGVALPQIPDGSFDEVMGPQGPMGSRPRCANIDVADGDLCKRDRFTETLPGGRSYSVLNIEEHGFVDETDVFTVPDGTFFALGDNRDNSMDSRFAQQIGGLGFIPMENLRGKVQRVVFSSAGASMLEFPNWRMGRYWQAVE